MKPIELLNVLSKGQEVMTSAFPEDTKKAIILELIGALPSPLMSPHSTATLEAVTEGLKALVTKRPVKRTKAKEVPKDEPVPKPKRVAKKATPKEKVGKSETE